MINALFFARSSQSSLNSCEGLLKKKKKTNFFFEIAKLFTALFFMEISKAKFNLENESKPFYPLVRTLNTPKITFLCYCL